MLSHIHIRDFAIVEALDLEFDTQLSALTGETGAGKSILLDALGLCLGDRADGDAIRPGRDKAEISVSFTLAPDNPALHWLEENDLADEHECILRRVLQPGGRSKSYINGRPAPLQALREIGEQLVDIHGQHAHQSLLRRDMQRQLLDDFAGHLELLGKVATLHARHQDVQARIAELEGDQQDYDARLELLRYQVSELDALKMSAEEILELDTEQRRLASAGDLMLTCQSLLDNLYESDASAQGMLSHAASELERLLPLDPALSEAHELINSALIQLGEGCDSLRRYAEHMDLDPARLQYIEERLTLVTDLARKHRLPPQGLPARLTQLQLELSELEGSEQRLHGLRAELARIVQEYRAAAVTLSESRRKAARELNERVTRFIRELGMPGGELCIQVSAEPDGPVARHGCDQILFEVRTNAGQPFGAVNRIASGGELSRIGLAIQVATAKVGRIPTLVFDEADAGMGGAVAEVVGRKLAQLGRTHQVLCVTHLPQVAAQATHHYQVSKHSDGASTRTQVDRLDEQQRVEELARMLGGVEITENTRNHAREMLERARAAAAEAPADA